MINKIEIINNNENNELYPTIVKLNGDELKGVRKVTYTMGVNECPTATIELVAVPGIESPAITRLNNVEELLRHITTRDLVNELAEREGVVHKRVEPYEDENIKVNGPARVLTVID